MTTMIERVARAICEADKGMLTSYETIARAAIEAMREPTEEMLAAVTAADQAEPFCDATISGVFSEMIDAALKEHA